MKKSILICLVLTTSFSYAQKSNVRAAYNYLKYGEIDKAKKAIDEAIIHEQTKNSDMAWYYRGLIYESMYNDSVFGKLDNSPLKTTYDSYRKSLDIAPGGEFIDDIKARLKILSLTFLAKGIDEFNDKNYTGALESFESVLKISPEDTSAIFNAGLAADKLDNNAKAADYYSRLIDMKLYEARKFQLLSNALKAKGDTAKALETIINGRKIFPDDYPLLLLQINIYLPQGKNKDAIELLKEAITKDEKNESLYFALGNTYDNLRATSLNKAAADDYFSLADIAYKKAIELKPDYSDAYFNLGVMHFNRGAEMANTANMLKSQSEYEKAK
ncbi:MAG: tetratricopeptide repeat protein, partial [Bacteroidia bacterium]|nr:tetratricopeptide repeat protein [Bacteroidia bacterium]